MGRWMECLHQNCGIGYGTGKTCSACDLSTRRRTSSTKPTRRTGTFVCHQRLRRLLLRAFPGAHGTRGGQLTSVQSGARQLVIRRPSLPEGARCDPIRNVSTARTSDARQNASQWPHRYPLPLETNTLLAPGPRTRTIASAVAVITHRQRPPDMHRTSRMPICTMSMTFEQSKPHSSWLPCDFSRACARRGVGRGR